MALAGKNYLEIDQHFYRNTTWATVDSAHAPIHVAVLWGSGPDRIVPTGPAQVIPSGGPPYTVAAGQTVTVSLWSGVTRVVPLSAGTRLGLYGPWGLYHHYRGTLVAQPSGGLYIVNVLSVEDYLRGLGEVPSSWPLEAAGRVTPTTTTSCAPWIASCPTGRRSRTSSSSG